MARKRIRQAQREPKVHSLKTWPNFYREIVTGQKTAELRRDDRDFRKGDTLLLEEFDPKLLIYTGHTCAVRVTAVLRDFAGLCDGYAVLSIALDNWRSPRFRAELAGKKRKLSPQRR